MKLTGQHVSMRAARPVGCGGFKDDSGQMTVELAVALPVLIAVLVIAVNALQFLGTCAAFDRRAHDLARVYAASPSYGQGTSQSCALMEQGLLDALGEGDDVEVSVSYAQKDLGFDEFTATLRYRPSLFGRSLRSEVFGVSLPSLSHTTRFVVDVYKPGVVA